MPIEPIGATDQEREAGVLNPAIPEDILSESPPVVYSKNKPLNLGSFDNGFILNFQSFDRLERIGKLCRIGKRTYVRSNDIESFVKYFRIGVQAVTLYDVFGRFESRHSIVSG